MLVLLVLAFSFGILRSSSQKVIPLDTTALRYLLISALLRVSSSDSETSKLAPSELDMKIFLTLILTLRASAANQLPPHRARPGSTQGPLS